MKNEIEADGFVTPEQYTKIGEHTQKKCGKDAVLAYLSRLDSCDLVAYISYTMFGFDTEVEFQEYLEKEIME